MTFSKVASIILALICVGISMWAIYQDNWAQACFFLLLMYRNFDTFEKNA